MAAQIWNEQSNTTKNIKSFGACKKIYLKQNGLPEKPVENTAMRGMLIYQVIVDQEAQR